MSSSGECQSSTTAIITLRGLIIRTGSEVGRHRNSTFQTSSRVLPPRTYGPTWLLAVELAGKQSTLVISSGSPYGSGQTYDRLCLFYSSQPIQFLCLSKQCLPCVVSHVQQVRLKSQNGSKLGSEWNASSPWIAGQNFKAGLRHLRSTERQTASVRQQFSLRREMNVQCHQRP